MKECEDRVRFDGTFWVVETRTKGGDPNRPWYHCADKDTEAQAKALLVRRAQIQELTFSRQDRLRREEARRFAKIHNVPVNMAEQALRNLEKRGYIEIVEG